MTFTSHMIEANGQNLHVKMAGPEGAPVILMLHGFPEYWASWAPVAEHFIQTHRVVLPDQRGYNLSSKPAEIEAYETKHLVADMAALIEQISPDQKVILCGHDWGASVAYALAMRHADKISHFVIANGVHPICFQKALMAGGAQTDASQYINYFCQPGVEHRLADDSFRRLLNMFEKFSAAPWLTDEINAAYCTAWQGPETVATMLNWYRASPMQVPKSGDAGQQLEITEVMREKYNISMPHLLLWGLQDVALLPEARADLGEFAADLTVKEIEDSGHWILHEKPEWVADQINEFMGR